MLSSRHEPSPKVGDGDRACLVTRERQPRRGLIRFVVGPDGAVVPDIDERLPGRGLWVAADRDTLRQAVEKSLFARAARRQVTADAGLVERVEQLLVRRCVDALSLARRGGGAVCGHSKVRQALGTARRGVLVEAADGAEDGRARLRALAADRAVVSCLMSAEIAAAFGRDHAVHAFVPSTGAGGGLAGRLVKDGCRLAGLRGGGEGLGLENRAGTCIEGATH